MLPAINYKLINREVHMNYKETAIEILTTLKDEIPTKKFKEKYFKNKNVFSRNRKFPLHLLICFLIKKSLKSYDLKLNDFREKFDIPEELIPSKQAVSKARIKLGWNIFEDIFQLSAAVFLKKNTLKNNWKGFQIYAIDGSDCEIPTTPETLKFFGNIASKKGKDSAGATSSTMTDVINGIVIDATIQPYKTSEREMAIGHCEKIKEYLNRDKSIIICDRGYPSYDFLGYMYDNHFKFVMRVKEQFTNMRTLGQQDGEVYLKCRKKMRTLRTIKVKLSDETTEYLITNLAKEEMTVENFKELYFLRWGIESKYQEIKNRIMLEEFSGSKVISIKQDYFISMFLSNISALLKNATDREIVNNSEEKERTKKYQANRSYITGCINNLLEIIMIRKVNIQMEIEQLIHRGKKKRSLIRPNRKNERNKNLNRRKHYINYKPCI